MLGIRLNPITRKRLKRFREMKRAHWSFWILVGLYAMSLMAQALSNSVPLYVRFEGKSYLPFVRFYPEDTFTGSGRLTRPDYKAIAVSEEFRADSGNWMVWPPIRFGPYEVIDPARLEIPDEVRMRFSPELRVGSLNVTADLTIVRSASAGPFFRLAERALRGRKLSTVLQVPPPILAGLGQRFRNRAAPRTTELVDAGDGTRNELVLSEFRSSAHAPKTVRVSLREVGSGSDVIKGEVRFGRDLNVTKDSGGLWERVPAAARERLLEGVQRRFDAEVPPATVVIGDGRQRVTFTKEEAIFPFRPITDHPMGIDSTGRDVLSRVLYGLRTSMTFGLVLVCCSLCVGTCIGAIQGYIGGVVDITCQRFIEIWSALPFLYIMILMGSVYGRSLWLLIFCYGLFNWIGISYYIRAEFLRLRRQPFVEAARCTGLPGHKIVFRHILPNALVPLITFFPFSLVGAVGALAALDYLGFGLPPPTPSWGEMLHQAQQFRWAWWLILYPSLSLFVIMLLGVFVGEGVRNAFDPKRFSIIE